MFLLSKIYYFKFKEKRKKTKLFNWGLGIGDWGLGPIPNPQSPIPNPQSPIPKVLLFSNNYNIYY